jgi:hypothetical protein
MFAPSMTVASGGTATSAPTASMSPLRRRSCRLERRAAGGDEPGA